MCPFCHTPIEGCTETVPYPDAVDRRAVRPWRVYLPCGHVEPAIVHYTRVDERHYPRPSTPWAAMEAYMDANERSNDEQQQQEPPANGGT